MPRLWTRLAIVVVAFVAGSILAAAALSAAIEQGSPQLAARIMPLNGSAKGRLADVSFVLARLAQEDGDRARADRHMRRARVLASQALESVPLNPKALRILALSGGDPGKKVDILYASNGQSRRDPLTQIMLIEQAARRGRIGEALTHYDALLRRDTGYRDIAGRQLALATADPRLASEVARLLRKEPPWRSLFYYYATREPQAFDGFISIHRSLQKTGEIPLETSAAFAATLVKAGRIEDALNIARMRNAAVLETANSLTERAFALEPSFPGTWLVAGNSAISMQPLREGGALLGLSRGSAGEVARRLTALAPGRYRVSVVTEIPEDPYASNQSEPILRGNITCVGSEGEVSGENTFAVTAGCPYQWLSIYLPESSRLDSEVYISMIKVRQID